MADEKTSTGIPLRSALPEAMCWDLSVLYPDAAAWETEFKTLDALLAALQECKGRLAESPERVKLAFESADRLSLVMERLYVYAHLKADEDTGNSVNNARLDRISAKDAEISGESAWIEPELLAMEPACFDALRNAPALAFYKRTLDEIARSAEHTLSEAEERILGMSSDALSSSEKIFSMLNDADLRFPKILDASGTEQELTHGNYIKFLEDPDRRVRRDAFNACYDTYASYKNTFAAILDGTVKSAVLEAKLRKYPSSLAAALDEDHIPVSVYDNLIGSIRANLPELHRYFALRAEIMGLDQIEMYDIMNPLVSGVSMNIPWEEAVAEVKEALSVLGSDYTDALSRAFSERWIDVNECRGKRSGAYSSGSYRKPPYILLNYSGTLDSVFTLAHELGHSMHSCFSDGSQEFHYASYRIFAAEVASTTNELLLLDSMMKKVKDPSVRAYLLNHLIDQIRGTVFRQTMFAEFERTIHAMAEDGEALSADALCERYFELNGAYHGPALVKNPKISYEWERIPHFHYNFYVYQYATGLSAAAALSKDILAGNSERYFRFLKAGNSKDVIEIMQDAGVDFLSPAPVDATMKLFSESVDSLAALLKH